MNQISIGYLSKNDILFIPYHILEITQLTGTVLEEKNLGKKDFRNTHAYFQDDKLNTIRMWVKEYIKPLAQKQRYTIGQLMIVWTLMQEHITYALVGTIKPEYVRINMKANLIQLSDEIVLLLKRAYSNLEDHVLRTYNKSMREFRGLHSCYF